MILLQAEGFALLLTQVQDTNPVFDRWPLRRRLSPESSRASPGVAASWAPAKNNGKKLKRLQVNKCLDDPQALKRGMLATNGSDFADAPNCTTKTGSLQR